MEDRKWREPLSSILYPPSSQLSSGDPSAVAPPVPIPNTEVKRCSPDGSATIGCARVGRRQNKNPAGYFQRGFCFVPPARPEDGDVVSRRRKRRPRTRRVPARASKIHSQFQLREICARH